jgi:O-antigen ligase
MSAALLLFTAAAFALPGEAAYGLVFYVAVLPFVVWRRRRPAVPDLGQGLALSLIAWSGLTLVWGEDPGHRRLGFAVAALCTGAFVAALHETFADPQWRRRWADMLVWAGTANAAWSLLHGLPSLLAGARILGWGVTRQPILGGAVMSLAYLTALARATEAGCPARKRGMYFAVCLLTALFVLAMQSRGALLAATGGTFLLLAAGPWRWRAALSLIAASLIWLFLVPSTLRLHAERLLLERGTSHRFEIWRTTWGLIRQKPVFGHGLAANVPPSTTGFPHSLFLSLLFYGGAVGLLLFAALGTLAVRRLARAPDAAERAWIAALCAAGLLSGLTDLGQITKGPGPIWFIVWVPLLLAVTRSAAAPGLPVRATLPQLPYAVKVAPPAPRNPARD